MTKQLSDLRRARGLIQGAYSKIIGRFGTQSEILDLLTEALTLIKAADVPGGVIEMGETPASSRGMEATVIVTAEPDTVTGSAGDELGAVVEDAEPPRQARTRTGKGKR